jgi:RNA-dependent RNA polymerase
MAAVQDLKFKTSLTADQVVARHCYALTFEREFVEEWEEELKRGMWGVNEDGEHDPDLLPKYVQLSISSAGADA